MGVEVLQDLPPQPVDGAVALVDDDHVERVGRQVRVVADLDRLRDRQLVDRVLVDLLVQLRLALEDGEDPLDGGDADPRRRVDGVVRQVLHVVLGGELPLRLGDRELVELQLGLLAQVRPVHQEQDPLGVRVLDQPVADVRGGERLPRAGRHLDQRPRTVLGQGLLQVADRLGLLAPQPPLIQRRHGLQPGAEGRQVRVLGDLPQPLGQRLGPVEGEHAAAAGIRVIPVGEPGLGSGGLVDERQRVDRRLHPVRQPLDVLAGLVLHLDQRASPPAWPRSPRRAGRSGTGGSPRARAASPG